MEHGRPASVKYGQQRRQLLWSKKRGGGRGGGRSTESVKASLDATKSYTKLLPGANPPMPGQTVAKYIDANIHGIVEDTASTHKSIDQVGCGAAIGIGCLDHSYVYKREGKTLMDSPVKQDSNCTHVDHDMLDDPLPFKIIHQ